MLYEARPNGVHFRGRAMGRAQRPQCSRARTDGRQCTTRGREEGRSITRRRTRECGATRIQPHDNQLKHTREDESKQRRAARHTQEMTTRLHKSTHTNGRQAAHAMRHTNEEIETERCVESDMHDDDTSTHKHRHQQANSDGCMCKHTDVCAQHRSRHWPAPRPAPHRPPQPPARPPAR